MILHVFWGWHDIRGRLRRWMKAGLASKAAGKATETMCVRPSGVIGYLPRLGVEWILLIYVVVLFFPGSKLSTHTCRQKDRNRESASVSTFQGVHCCTVCNGVRGSLCTDLLPISVHTRKIAHNMAESAQAARRENKER